MVYLHFSWLLTSTIIDRCTYNWHCGSAAIMNFMLDIIEQEKERERERVVANRW